MPYLGVSQRPVVAERLQGAGADAQLLADILVVHPAVQRLSFPLSRLPMISFTRSDNRLSLPTISSYFSFEIITTFIFYLVFVVNNPFRLQSKACVCIKQWLCNGLAACGSKWQGVALSTDQ